jgi:predicted aspartyl protease
MAWVILRDPNGDAMLGGVPMLIDTGADITLVPRSSVEELGVSLVNEGGYELVGFGGEQTFAEAVRLEMSWDKRTFRGLFVVADQSWGILGRNVLNTISLTLDGPNLSWTA